MYFLFQLKQSILKVYIYILHFFVVSSFVLFFTFLFTCNVYATTTPVTDTLKSIGLVIEDFKQANQYTWTQISDFIDTMSQVVGLPKKGHSSGGHSFDPSIIKSIDPDVDDTDPNSIGNWISNQINIQDNDDITVTNDFRTMFNDFNDSLESNYAYTFPLLSNENQFSSINQYLQAKDIMSSRPDVLQSSDIWIVQRPSSGSAYLMLLSLETHPYLVFKERTQNGNTGNMLLVQAYDVETGSYFNKADACYRWDLIDGVYSWQDVTETTANGINANNNRYACIYPNKAYTTRQSNLFMSSPKSIQVRYFSYNDQITLDKVLYQDYYYNNDVWSDFSTTTGDYTFSSNNINTVSYGDIISYINDYNDENDKPPTTVIVNNYIEDKNIDDNGGSGGGSGGSGSDDNGSIFDWLKNLGKVLGDLIKGVGEFITEIIAGLVSALNDLMSSLSGLITDTLGSLTTVFSSIIDFVYAGLPDSVKGIMMLALTVSLLITVIQLVRK